ncbi:uncharacterized protein IL334_005472 [Kwoniella shivajii]|uniref:Cytoplasmic protein n=1 Tax=Kwoniella shivajii TaxID=564305 RepID=A0ABZ1D6B8_9TREE|nr:hypothetical protein IL334_005472 [Kwoniella shivajii]
MVTTKKLSTLPVTTFLISTVLLSIVLPSTASASPIHHDIINRHEDDEHGSIGMGINMHGDEMGDDREAYKGDTESYDTDKITSSIVSGGENSFASSSASSSAVSQSPSSKAPSHPPSGHDHGSHTAAKTVLDDESVHEWHHFPPTYLDVDFKLDNDSAIFGEEFDDTWNPETLESHKRLMMIHTSLFYGAYFGLLPISLALRAADHSSHHIANAIFLVVAVLGWLAGKAYKAAQKNRYEGAVHERFSDVLVLLSIGLTIVDAFELIRKAIRFYNQDDRSWSSFLHEVLQSHKNEEDISANIYEMVGLVDEPVHEREFGRHDNQVVFALDEDEDEGEGESLHDHVSDGVENHSVGTSNLGKPQRPSALVRQWTPPSRNSTGSEGTLQDTPGSSSSSHNSFMQKSRSQIGAYDAHAKDHHGIHENRHEHEHEHGEEHEQEPEHIQPIWSREKSTGIKRAAEIVLTWIRRSQIIIAYVVFLTEFTEYTGMCRAGLINSCAAHYIKGSIFFWYGVLTFARYLGAYADLGWAWNKRPGGVGITAEMIECSVIFTYGITNTWMERFGSSPEDPYTVKQVQHISIAIMFWFAGLSGILLESRWVRKVMGSFISGGRRDVHEPPTYAFSYNPLPALVIGVTGLAMAAHHQEYVFQVSIHSLWGILLAGGSLFRLLTYFFLFLRPPVESTLASRPPTEILTSFGYAAGAIVFMLSNEEIAWAAMRAGWDDMMAFLNFTIALTCLIFCWCIVVMAIKGWAGMRMTTRHDGRKLEEEEEEDLE